jgi:hypothetical protein
MPDPRWFPRPRPALPLPSLRFALALLLLALAGLLAVLPPGPARAAEPKDAADLIGRILAAHGGWTRLAGVKAYRVEGELFSVRRHDASPTVRVSAGPARFKVLIDYADGHEARLLDGANGWRAVGGEAFEPSGGPMLAAVTLQAARAAVPWILHGRERDARLIDPYDADSTRWPGLELTLEGGLLLRVYADPVTWRVRMSQGLLTHGGMQTHFETFYEDWKQVDGIWFAHLEQNWASGAHTGQTMLKRVILNPTLAPDEFAPPKPAGPAKSGTGSSS